MKARDAEIVGDVSKLQQLLSATTGPVLSGQIKDSISSLLLERARLSPVIGAQSTIVGAAEVELVAKTALKEQAAMTYNTMVSRRSDLKLASEQSFDAFVAKSRAVSGFLVGVGIIMDLATLEKVKADNQALREAISRVEAQGEVHKQMIDSAMRKTLQRLQPVQHLIYTVDTRPGGLKLKFSEDAFLTTRDSKRGKFAEGRWDWRHLTMLDDRQNAWQDERIGAPGAEFPSSSGETGKRVIRLSLYGNLGSSYISAYCEGKKTTSVEKVSSRGSTEDQLSKSIDDEVKYINQQAERVKMTLELTGALLGLLSVVLVGLKVAGAIAISGLAVAAIATAGTVIAIVALLYWAFVPKYPLPDSIESNFPEQPHE